MENNMKTVSLEASHAVINNKSLSQVGTLLKLDPSTISNYRKGRSLENNLSLENLIKLTEDFKFNHNKELKDEIEVSEDEIKYFKENYLKERPILNKRSILFNIGNLTNNEVIKASKIVNKETYTLTDYQLILKINKFVKAVQSVNQDKLLENFENIIHSTGKSMMKLSLDCGRPNNYISSIIHRHKIGKVFLSDLSENSYKQLSEIFYPKEDTTNKLKEELLKGLK